MDDWNGAGDEREIDPDAPRSVDYSSWMMSPGIIEVLQGSARERRLSY